MDNHKWFERQPRARARLNDKILHLHETIPLRLGNMTVLSNSQKPTLKVKENEETEICYKQMNKTKLLKQILIKGK